MCPSAGWWPEAISSATDGFCALSHVPAPQLPLQGGLGASFPFLAVPPCIPLLLAASSGALGGFYPFLLRVQKVCMFNSLFQTGLI